MRTFLIGLAVVVSAIILVAAGAFAWLYAANAGNHTVAATTADDRSLPAIELGGYRFHAESHGDAHYPAVLVLHGGPGGDYRMLLPLTRLADEYHVVFYDQRGSGLSPRVPDAELTFDRFVADVGLFVDRFSPDQPIRIVGHSWGAMLAAGYIARNPARVSHAVLAEPGFLDHEGMERFNERTGLDAGRPSFAVMTAMSTAWAESLHIEGPDPYARADYRLGRFLRTPLEDHPLAGYYPDNDLRNAVAPMWRFGARASRAVPASGTGPEGRLIDLAAGIERWQGQALFLAGSENTIIGADVQQTHARRFRDARLVIIEGAGHTMIGERPDVSIGAIRAFLASGASTR